MQLWNRTRRHGNMRVLESHGHTFKVSTNFSPGIFFSFLFFSFFFFFFLGGGEDSFITTVGLMRLNNKRCRIILESFGFTSLDLDCKGLNSPVPITNCDAARKKKIPVFIAIPLLLHGNCLDGLQTTATQFLKINVVYSHSALEIRFTKSPTQCDRHPWTPPPNGELRFVSSSRS